ncbi:MAG: hypothetical protein Q8M47_06395 [Devosia sp.]|nr:hypothetical protein [Devosia sp.]
MGDVVHIRRSQPTAELKRALETHAEHEARMVTMLEGFSAALALANEIRAANIQRLSELSEGHAVGQIPGGEASDRPTAATPNPSRKG